jgi:hypothetical protein
LRTHQFARSVERIIVAASSDSALHGGSLFRHCVFSLQPYTNERCKEAAGRRIVGKTGLLKARISGQPDGGTRIACRWMFKDVYSNI